MKKRMIMLLLGTSLALSACGGSNDNSNGRKSGTNETAAGSAEDLFQSSCSSCHGGNLKGGFGPALNQVGSKYSEAEIENIIQNGKGQMPAHILKGDDAKAVAGWLAKKK
ncbi:cytochrome c551 [Peribacillus kribbensis]|uniref:cytochrome c551 n=1 Tax=Peribacillus kribbensis TaxID=356658 RepID=UPI00041DAF53|nr:cytochrome c [Peribacillus kribbensis]